MPDFPVAESKRAALEAKLTALGLREQDLEERFIRSSGPGGQHVNKTSTCVVLRHLPTGLEVRSQRERSQALNRFLARRLLAAKYEALVRGRASAAEQAREKIRRQKRRRSRRAKEKMLAAKHHQAEKKQLRRYRGED
jgi:peptide chain release factor